MKLKGYFHACISSATYGLIPLFAIPLIRDGIELNSILFYRFACAATILSLFLLLKKESFTVNKKELVPLIALGLLFALAAQFLFWAYSYLSVGIASTLLFLYPVFVAILMAVLFKEKVSIVSQIAILISFIGIALLSVGDLSGHVSIKGIILILCSALSYAFYIIIVNKSAVQQMSGYKLTFYALLISAVFFLIKALFSGGVQPLQSTSQIISITSLGLFSSVVSCVSMVYAVRYIGSTATAALGALEPVVAVSVGILAFNEPFTSNLAFGTLFIIMGVTMIILSDRISSGLKHIPRHHKLKY